MSRREDLLKQCEDLGVFPEKSRNRKDKETGLSYKESTVKDCEKAIQQYYLNKYEQEGIKSPFIDSILKLDSPMLALQVKHLKPEIQDLVWKDNSNWVFQEKIDGCRCMLCYDRDFGWDMYSRNKSITDCLPISYRTKILLPRINNGILDRYNIKSFILDTELVPLLNTINNMVDGTSIVADTQLNLVTSILGSLDDLSHKMQETNPLKFVAFDLIMLNNSWLTQIPLEKRDKSLNGIVQILHVAGMNNRINKVLSTMTNKEQFYNQIISTGGEGVVAKDLTSTYDLLGRRHGEWCKIKRSVSQALMIDNDTSVVGDTIDAFITGFKEGTPGTNNEGLVGALEFSVYLTDENNEYLLDENGDPIIHHLATISGFTDELRHIISTKDEFGNVALRKDFYGRAAEIDGQDISSKNFRFAHAIFKGWRPDRSAESCKFQKPLLEKLVL